MTQCFLTQAGDEAKETMESDTPKQESPPKMVHLQYNFMRKSDEGVIQGKLSSDVSFSGLQPGTSQQRQEYEFMSSVNTSLPFEPLQVHPTLKKPEGDLDSTNPKQECSHQPVARCCALAQANEWLNSQRSEQSTIQNVAGLNPPANYSGKREQREKDDVEKQLVRTGEKCQSCNKSGENSNEPVSFLVRPNARCSIIHQLAPARESSSKDHTSSESRSIIGHQIILTNEWEKLFSQLSLGPKHLKDTVKKFFKCPDCGKNYAQKSSINRHLQKFHGRGNQALNTGQERSSSLSPGPCPYQKVYLEKKSLSCPGMVKGNANNLSGHSQQRALPSNVYGLSSAPCSEPQTHSIKERRFQCSICGKAFTERSSLARHQFLHGAEKPFKCLFCDKSYTQKCHLKRHVQKLHIVKP